MASMEVRQWDQASFVSPIEAGWTLFLLGRYQNVAGWSLCGGFHLEVLGVRLEPVNRLWLIWMWVLPILWQSKDLWLVIPVTLLCYPISMGRELSEDTEFTPLFIYWISHKLYRMIWKTGPVDIRSRKTRLLWLCLGSSISSWTPALDDLRCF